jgi:hypothetical protein
MSSWGRRRSDDRPYHKGGRSLYGPPRSSTYSREIRWDTPADAHHSIAFADGRWHELAGHRSDRVHLLQAMNEAANRAKVSKGENSEEHEVLRRWVTEHKGNE